MSFLPCITSYSILISIQVSQFKQCAEHTWVLQGTAEYEGKGAFYVYTCIYMCVYTHMLVSFDSEKSIECEQKCSLLGLWFKGG